MTIPAVDNRTDFEVHPQLLLDRDGEKLVVMVKASFELGPDGTLDIAPEARSRKIRASDVPWGEPEIPSIAYPCDVALRKPGTDVVVVAKAYPPGGRPSTMFDVLARVGPIKKTLRIFGLRVWESGGNGLSPPRPVTEVELRYDYAWGGRDDSDPAKILEEPRNPVGCGMVRDGLALTHKAAPQIEDVEMLIKSFRTRPPPAGMSPIGRSYEPRRKYAGTYDKLWMETRAPLPPDDFDDRFNCFASAGMHADTPLVGGEPVELAGLLPGGATASFTLPRVILEIEFRVKNRPPEIVRPHLDTVLLDLLEANEEKPPAVEMVWRASTRPPRRMKDAKVIVSERSPQ